MKRLVIVAAVCTSAWAASPRPAAADVVADWNVCAQPLIGAGRAAIAFGFGSGPATVVDLAIVHLAMHDAIQARQEWQGRPSGQ